MSDPSRPRTLVATTSTPEGSERYYDFSLVHPQQDVGVYAEDVFKLKILDRDMNVRAGVRLDMQNGFASFSPRTNVNYQVSEHVRVGLAYGLSLKAPGLAQRYPGPTFMEIPLLNAYNGKANESMYLLYVERYDPTNKNIRPSQNQTMEFTTQVKLGDFNLSVAAFNKMARNGISTTQTKTMAELPKYQATLVPGQKPIVTEIGTTRYLLDYHTMTNILRSNSQGLEVILNTPKITQLATSFNLSGGIFRTDYRATGVSFSSPNNVTNTIPEYAKIGVYIPKDRVSYLSSGRISTTTHIPRISLIAQFTAEFSLIEKTVRSATDGIPVGYYTNDARYVTIESFDHDNPAYNYLYKPLSELNSENVPKVTANYHLSIGKEIKNRFRFSFNVYNFFNHQPTYINSGGTIIYPNPAPTFGAELSLKL
jgi:outer membrane receptor protein involved in Fe transport